MDTKLKLYGFNNLTKSLHFNIYDVCYAKGIHAQQDYVAYIDEMYNADRLIGILRHLTSIIGAQILSLSKQDYNPMGASATLLIAQEPLSSLRTYGDTLLSHLDKSHISVHTYPEYHPETAVATFRVDIDVSTCGQITPLHTLDYLITSFDSDIITMDYSVRGFTRDIGGIKLFMDDEMKSIQDYIAPSILNEYDAVDINVPKINLFHTKMLLHDIVLEHHLFRPNVDEFPQDEQIAIAKALKKEMLEVFNSENA